jgi:hypothetical protein
MSSLGGAPSPRAGRSRPGATRASVARACLGVVGLAQAEIGVWGLLSPRGFYTGYPGLGHHWVSALGTYNEHLVRDFAAMELGFAVLLLSSAVWFERRLVLVAGASFLAATVPHFAYHLTTTESFSTADDAASLIGFAIEIAIVIAAMLGAPKGTHSAAERAEPRGRDRGVLVG